jgi:hypothetical protein
VNDNSIWGCILLPEVRSKPTEWKKRIETFVNKEISEAFAYFETIKTVPKIDEFRDKVLSIIKRDVELRHLETEAVEIERNAKGKGKEYLTWAKAVISSLKEDKDFLKELREWREKLVKKLRK